MVRVLERLAEQRGLPESIVMDNGPEFTSKALDAWAHGAGVKLHFIRPGNPEVQKPALEPGKSLAVQDSESVTTASSLQEEACRNLRSAVRQASACIEQRSTTTKFPRWNRTAAGELHLVLGSIFASHVAGS